MSATGKIVAALLGVGIPAAVIGADVEWFSLNPLTMVFAITAMLAGCLYLVTYHEHE